MKPAPLSSLPPVVALFCLMSFAGLSGCAHYEYDIVRPPDLSQHVGAKSPVHFPLGDLEYGLQSYDNHLVMLITNRANEPVKLLGGDSYAIDPKGESHPLADRVIPPGNHAKLILPPPPTQVRETGPHFGFGVGVGVAHSGHPYYSHSVYGAAGVYDDPGPRYYSVYDASDATFWQWEGETEARLVLAFEKGKERFTDEFVFRRKKM
jgi:hypothetical protein